MMSVNLRHTATEKGYYINYFNVLKLYSFFELSAFISNTKPISYITINTVGVYVTNLFVDSTVNCQLEELI